MNDGVEQETYCVDKNVPLLALDLSATSSLSLLARIVPVRINPRPLFLRFSRSMLFLACLIAKYQQAISGRPSESDCQVM